MVPPDVLSPDVLSPDVLSPDVLSPDVLSPDVLPGHLNIFRVLTEDLINFAAIREHCNLWRNFYDVQDNWNNIQVGISHSWLCNTLYPVVVKSNFVTLVMYPNTFHLSNEQRWAPALFSRFRAFALASAKRKKER
jgi:hypothetical protein